MYPLGIFPTNKFVSLAAPFDMVDRIGAVFGNSPVVKEIDSAAQSELLKLIQDLDAKINQAGVSGIGTNQTITSAENSVKTAMNQNEGK